MLFSTSKKQDETKLALIDTQVLYEVKTKALDQRGIMLGALLVVETAKASVTAIGDGDLVMGQRFLQLVEQTFLGKDLARIAPGKQLVQKLFLNRHVMILLSIIMASSTKFLTVPAKSVCRDCPVLRNSCKFNKIV
jgi:hypothetical protein